MILPSPSIIAAPLTANASGNCLTSFPCNLKVDGKSQYLCKSTVNVNSLVLLTYLKAGCHNYVEVRILSFWEARNVKHKGELMGLTCSSLTQSLISLLYLLLFFTVKWGYVRSVGGDGNDGVRMTRQSSHVSSFVPQGGSLRIIQIKLLRPSNNLLLRHGLAPDNSEPLLDGATVSYCVRET
ncbi:hypothetical protein Bca52824_089744 [Brassica carinata]|uniref:Uncharacterized protein n=1 Tax=Brassica carinata TaxID=52824 RepID=A0A8X7TS27_BRACI|nr:hypothetical protein Bca52824_089744 [Brassica carinata]